MRGRYSGLIAAHCLVFGWI